MLLVFVTLYVLVPYSLATAGFNMSVKILKSDRLSTVVRLKWISDDPDLTPFTTTWKIKNAHIDKVNKVNPGPTDDWKWGAIVGRKFMTKPDMIGFVLDPLNQNGSLQHIQISCKWGGTTYTCVLNATSSFPGNKLVTNSKTVKLRVADGNSTDRLTQAQGSIVPDPTVNCDDPQKCQRAFVYHPISDTVMEDTGRHPKIGNFN